MGLKPNFCKTNIITLMLFIILTLLYFKYVLTSPPNSLVTRHLATDLYGHFAHVHERLLWLTKGFLPIGDYWVPRGGGFPAATNDQLIIPQEFTLMIIYAATGSLTLSLKIALMMFYLLSLIFSYWYGITVFKRKDASIILAISYTFSLYGANQLEHLELIGLPFLVLMTLTFFERALLRKSVIDLVLTAVSLFLVLLSNLYGLFFLLLFIGCRFVFQLILEESYQDKLVIIEYLLFLLAIFLLLSIPYILPQLQNRPTDFMLEVLRNDIFRFSRPPYLYFLRDTHFTPYATEIYFMYLGLATTLLAILPLIVGSAYDFRKMYIFHMVMLLFFIFYSIGQYAPVNIALLIHDYIPFASFISVPGRSLLIGYLDLSVCAGVGYISLTDLVTRYTKINQASSSMTLRHFFERRTLTSQSKKRVIFVLLIFIIFSDLTIGFEPRTMPMILNDNEAYKFIREQPGDFRIIEIPSMHDQQAMTYIYTGHDTLNFVLWGFGFFKPLYRFAELYSNYLELATPVSNLTSSRAVGFWDFEELNNSTVMDLSGMNNNGRIYGAKQTEGVFGYALSFDGVDDFVEVEGGRGLDLTTSGAIEFWVRLPEDAVEQGVIVCKGGGWDRAGWMVTTINKNHIRFHWQSGRDIILDSATSLSYGEWHHVVAVNDGYTLRIYIDGKRDPATLVLNTVVNASTSKPVRIGLADNGQLPFKGEIDELKIYNKPLTSEEAYERYLTYYIHNLAKKSAFYGVEYVLINLNPSYYQTRDAPSPLDAASVNNIRMRLELSKDYRLVYADNFYYIYENLWYQGRVFAVPIDKYKLSTPYDIKRTDVKLKYTNVDLNTIKISLENQEPVYVIVSQSFSDKWVATIESELPNADRNMREETVQEIASIQYVPILNTGRHQITLHYTGYEASLSLYPIFYSPLIIILTISLRQKIVKVKDKKQKKSNVKPSSKNLRS